MKVVLTTPNYHQPRGNTVTVERIYKGLIRFGVEAEIVSITEETPLPRLPQGDLVHGFNAYHFSKYWGQRSSDSPPNMITITGTDLNHYLFEQETKEQIIQCLNDAKAVHVFNTKAKDLLLSEVPWIQDKTFLIPQGMVEFPSVEGNKPKEIKEEGSFLFVLPAGIRKVKNIAAAISMLTALHKQEQRIRLWIAGPIIEEAEGGLVRELVAQNADWIRYLGQLPHGEMGEIYKSADVVLNSSLSEGQSSAILEGMSAGIPVLVSDIEGNRDIVAHGITGYLYQNEEEFMGFAQQLMHSQELRTRLGKEGRDYIANQHSFEEEMKSLVNIYRDILLRS
jgi:glycosyltransferase involved in cell wall biosynthesis